MNEDDKRTSFELKQAKSPRIPNKPNISEIFHITSDEHLQKESNNLEKKNTETKLEEQTIQPKENIHKPEEIHTEKTKTENVKILENVLHGKPVKETDSKKQMPEKSKVNTLQNNLVNVAKHIKKEKPETKSHEPKKKRRSSKFEELTIEIDNNDDEEEEVTTSKKNLFKMSTPKHCKIDKSWLPNIGTNVRDIKTQMKAFEELNIIKKKFMIIGLDYECFLYDSFEECSKRLKRSFDKCKKENVSFPVSPVWIDVETPSSEDIYAISHMFSLHPLTEEDLLQNDSGEKYEVFKKYIYLSFFYPDSDDNTIRPTDVLIFQDFVLTIHQKPLNIIEKVLSRIEHRYELVVEEDSLLDVIASSMRKRSLESSDSLLKYDSERQLSKKDSTVITSPEKMDSIVTYIPSPDWVMYSMLDAIIDTLMIDVNTAIQESENVDELIYFLDKKESEDFLMRLGNLRKLVSLLRRLLDPKQNIVSMIVTRDFELISKNTQTHMRDVLDHIANCIEKLEFSRDSLNHTHSNYLTKLSFELSESSRATHNFMNNITIAATVLVPFQIVGGLFGMNVKVIGQDDDNLFGFWSIILCLVIFSTLTFIFGYRFILANNDKK